MCLDCADICAATARVLGRPTWSEHARPVIAAQMAACALACADLLKTLPMAEAA